MEDGENDLKLNYTAVYGNWSTISVSTMAGIFKLDDNIDVKIKDKEKRLTKVKLSEVL